MPIQNRSTRPVAPGKLVQHLASTVLYARVSSDEQREKQTIQTQVDYAHKWSDLQQLPIQAQYLDDGISGTIALDERAAGARLLADAEAGAFKRVIVYKLDRLGRDARHILNAVHALEACGVQVKSMTEPFDTSDPSGRFLLTILAAQAALARDTIVENSINGTLRLARDGAWLGGIVPYGYRVVGKDREARLVVSDDEVLDKLTESDVVRTVFEMIGTDGRSTQYVADHLNRLGVPPAYIRDGRTEQHFKDTTHAEGKRTVRVAGIWRPGRVLSMLRNTTYRGVHQYGKRARTLPEMIEREVPAIVTPELWHAAQRTIERNWRFGKRNSRRQYLLRGLMKCGHCGLTYSGCAWPGYKGGPVKLAYGCNGRNFARGIFGLNGQRCPGKGITGKIEETIWSDIEGFLRHPGDVLDELARRLADQAGQADRLRTDAAAIQAALDKKASERDLVITLYRTGRISAAELDRQLEQVDQEEAEAKQAAAELLGRAAAAEQATSHLRSADALLARLNERLDQALTWEAKRALLETLVEKITITTTERDGRRVNVVQASYRFPALEDRTDMPASINPSDLTLEREHVVATRPGPQRAAA